MEARERGSDGRREGQEGRQREWPWSSGEGIEGSEDGGARGGREGLGTGGEKRGGERGKEKVARAGIRQKSNKSQLAMWSARSVRSLAFGRGSLRWLATCRGAVPRVALQGAALPLRPGSRGARGRRQLQPRVSGALLPGRGNNGQGGTASPPSHMECRDGRMDANPAGWVTGRAGGRTACARSVGGRGSCGPAFGAAPVGPSALRAAIPRRPLGRRRPLDRGLRLSRRGRWRGRAGQLVLQLADACALLAATRTQNPYPYPVQVPKRAPGHDARTLRLRHTRSTAILPVSARVYNVALPEHLPGPGKRG